MTKFRKKPVEVEAFQWKMGYHVPDWFLQARNLGIVSSDREGTCFIHTLEGTMRASIGDWIIQGVQGEIYPCKPDIFEATYEKV